MPQENDLFSQTEQDNADAIHLPNWREVNRAESARLAQERSAAARKSSGEGRYINLLQDVRRRFAGDPRQQITYFLGKASIPAAIGRRREVSEKTRSEYGAVLLQCVTDLTACRQPINNLTDLGRAHVVSLVRYWGEEQANSEGTIAWRVSILRRFLTLVGKAAAVPKGRVWRETLKQNGIVAGTLGRTYLPELPKGWLDLGIDPVPVIAAIASDEPVVASNLEMMWAFGLRVNESVQLQPGPSDKGAYLTVHRGTKGGKLREVKFSGDPARAAWQRECLERAKLLAGKHPKGVLAIRGLTLLQMKSRMRYLVRSRGITKDGLGITPHGLRHQFGTDLFKEMSGLPAPVLEALPKEEYTRNAAKVQAAFLEVSRQMGHERPSISGAYVSTVPQMERLERARLERWLDLFAGCSPSFHDARVADAWLIGRAGAGLVVAEGVALQVAVRVDIGSPALAQALQSLATALTLGVGHRVAVVPWLDLSPPDEAAEILIREPEPR